MWRRRSRNTPLEIVERLNREVNAALADPAVKARMAEAWCGEPLSGSVADFTKLVAQETEKWAQGCQIRRSQGGVIAASADIL